MSAIATARPRMPRAALPLLLAGAALLVPAFADSRALSSLPIPPGGKSRAIATDLVQNGLSTSIASLAVSTTVEEALAFYRGIWAPSENDPGHAEERLGEWSVISRVVDDALLVVQLRESASGPEGIVSALSRGDGAVVALPSPPIPAGGRLLSNLGTSDPGSTAVTSVVSATARSGEVAAFYRDRLARDGWRLASDRLDDGASVLLFDRRGARLELVVSEVDGQSIVVINEVRLDD